MIKLNPGLWQNGITWMKTQEKEMLVAHTADVQTEIIATSRLITHELTIRARMIEFPYLH